MRACEKTDPAGRSRMRRSRVRCGGGAVCGDRKGRPPVRWPAGRWAGAAAYPPSRRSLPCLSYSRAWDSFDAVSSDNLCTIHCNGNPIYVFLFWELRGLSQNVHFHVSVSDLYIPRIGPHSSFSRTGRSIVGIYKSLTDTRMWKVGLWLRNSFSGNIVSNFQY